MDFETFKKAVDSLEEWDGIVGVMGGEPTILPELGKGDGIDPEGLI